MKHDPRFIQAGLALLLALSPVASGGAAELPVVRIGVVIDGPSSIDRETGRLLFERELTELTRGEFDVRSPADKMLVADATVPGIQRALDRLLADPEVAVVVAGGVISSHLAARRRDLPKPVVASMVVDPRVQGLPLQGQVSGVRNLTYFTSPVDVQRDLRVFREVVALEHVVLLYGEPLGKALPALVDHFAGQIRALGIEVTPVPVGPRAQETLGRLPPTADGVFVALPLHLSGEEFAALVQGLIARGLPSFTALGTNQVRSGLLVGLHADGDLARLTRRAALTVQRILLGEEPAELPVLFSRQERLSINVQTAEAIGVSPSWAVLTEAQLIGQPHQEIPRQLTLLSAVAEALRANLDLASSEKMVRAGEELVSQARAALRPQIDLQATGAVIDPDQASAFQPERAAGGSGALSQVLFSEAARANLSIQKRLQKGRGFERDRVRLDVVHHAATTYLNLLLVKTVERTQRRNLELTRSNLELARLRQVIGMSGPEEVYRWESQIATGRKNAIAANARRNVAEIALNRALHRPLEEHFEVAETGLHDESLISHDPRFIRYMESKRNFGILRGFMVEDGLASAPELQQLDQAIAAQERGLAAARRALWSPTTALRGEVSDRFYEDGAGADAAGDGSHWSVGASVSLPLFSGGAKLAARREAEEELAGMRLQRQAVAERVEQRLRSALHLAGASYAGIGLSADAEVAAKQNLELVKDAYRRGAVDILALLDAQNAALQAEQGAAGAAYDFLLDLMEVERALGKFYFFATREQRDAWFGRLETYFDAAAR